jgi:hypothetical protein
VLRSSGIDHETGIRVVRSSEGGWKLERRKGVRVSKRRASLRPERKVVGQRATREASGVAQGLSWPDQLRRSQTCARGERQLASTKRRGG